MSKLNIYIAAPYASKEDMPHIARRLEERGHTLTHEWWKVEDIEEEFRTRALLREQAMLDVEGVLNADAVLLINSAKSEGKAVETGLAIASGKPIVAVGRLGEFSKNVFHYLDTITWVVSLDGALNVLDLLDEAELIQEPENE